LIGFRTGDHVRLVSIGYLRQGLKTTGAESALHGFTS
jgi:hypothetical protein